MKAIVEISNNIKLEIEEQDDFETLHKAIILGNPRRKCICGNTEGFYLTSHKSTTDKGTFTFINLKCPKCEARSAFSKYKAGGYFWKDFEQYKPKGETPPPPAEQ